MICWLQTAAKRLKVKISHSDMWAADVFYYKTCHNRFVYLYRKIPKENPLLNKEVSSQSSGKRILGFDEKENCDTDKILSFI